jgi:hypothetical protein
MGDHSWYRITTVWDGLARKRKPSSHCMADWITTLAYISQNRTQCHGLKLYGWCPWGGQICVTVDEQGEIKRIDLVWMDGPHCHSNERILLMPR